MENSYYNHSLDSILMFVLFVHLYNHQRQSKEQQLKEEYKRTICMLSMFSLHKDKKRTLQFCLVLLFSVLSEMTTDELSIFIKITFDKTFT
jgi:hypothetical protein